MQAIKDIIDGRPDFANEMWKIGGEIRCVCFKETKKLTGAVPILVKRLFILG